MAAHHADKDAHLQKDNLLFLPSGPLPSHFFSQNQGEARRNALHGRGSELEGVSLLSGFSRIVAGFEAYLL